MARTTEVIGPSDAREGLAWRLVLERAWAFVVAWREPLIVAGLTAFAAFLRFYRLDELPFGLHGDEGIVGLEAHRILDVGWIGPYVRISAGFPAGSLYVIAPAIDLLGDSVFSVRAAMALLGTATIPVAYLAFRQGVSWRIASVSAFLLAVSDWHIHLSRVAYLVIAWPFIELVSLGFLLAGFRTGRWYFYAAAGVAAGFCWYAYNAALLYPAGIAAYLGFRIVVGGGFSRTRELVLYGILGVSALIAAWPMLDYALADENDFWSHHEAVSITKRPEYQEADTVPEKAELYTERTWDYFKAIAWEPLPDAADGLGVEPPIDGFTALLAIAGGLIALWRWRQPIYAIALIMVPLMAMGAVLTYVGTYRRTFGILPFVMLLAGTTLGLLWERADRLSPYRRVPALALIGVVLGVITYSNLHLYFDTFEESRLHRTTYFPEMTSVSEELADLPDGTYLYFYSLRAQRGNEIRRFLAPQLDEGIDRSHEFGEFSLTADRDPPFVYAFMDAYLETMPRVIARHPGGVVTEERDKYGLLYRTYEFPEGSEMTGDGSVPFTSEIERLAEGPALAGGAALPATVSCVPAEKQPLPLAYYRYEPSSDVYAVARGRYDPLARGAMLAIWKVTPAGVAEVSCAATGSLAIEGRAADMPELGLTASPGEEYYVGFAVDGPGGAAPAEALRLWEQER